MPRNTTIADVRRFVRWATAAALVAAVGLSVPLRLTIQSAASQQPRLRTNSTTGGLTGYEVLNYGMDVVAGNTGVMERACTAGKQPLGGGFYFPNSNQISGGDVVVIESSPRVTATGTTGWRVVANNRSSSTQRMEVYVICGYAAP